jgi:cation diffusion facilitator CzcD-associated flavoprotein CzcO
MTLAESTTQPDAPVTPIRTRALIIGTGFAGLGMAIALQRQGVDFVIVEKADDIGGTWRDNSYPGCACDVPSHLYSFSFEPKATWSKLFSPQPEILDYLQGVADKYGLRRYIRFGQKVSRAHWDDGEYRWHVFTESGDEYVAQFLISGAGALHIPRTPDIEGISEFRGPAFHSAEWDHSVDLTGKRVAIIGTGASAIQIVPELVRREAGVAEVQLYQRTPPWVVPRPNSLLPNAVRKAFAMVPGLRFLVRSGIYWGLEGLGFAMTQRPGLLRAVELVGRWNIRRNVKDKDLRRRLTPSYRAGCKRILYSGNYYQAVANRKATLITDGISHVTANGIVTADGVEHPADVIVYATGFHATEYLYPMTITGRGGRTLEDLWRKDGARAYLGCMMPGFPNLWSIYGPNTNGGLTVASFHEKVALYALQCMETLVLGDGTTMEVRPDAFWRYNRLVDERNHGMVWSDPRAHNYYWTEHGRSATMNPFYTAEMSGFLRKPDLADLVIA